MDEVLVANFMVLDDLVRDEHFDLDRRRRGLGSRLLPAREPRAQARRPMPGSPTSSAGCRCPTAVRGRARSTADYNAEMIDQVARFPWLRDKALFVGNPDDIVPDRLGPGPADGARSGPKDNFDFVGYVTGSTPTCSKRREALRDRLGYAADEQVCLVSVGGSGVGGPLLRRVAAAHRIAKQSLPGLRTVLVAGPRIDPDSLPTGDGLEVHGFLPDLLDHMVACDVAVVQGGLTTTMELTATGRPFLYFPLQHHFEQNFHVAHRLDRYGAGRRMDYATVRRRCRRSGDRRGARPHSDDPGRRDRRSGAGRGSPQRPVLSDDGVRCRHAAPPSARGRWPAGVEHTSSQRGQGRRPPTTPAPCTGRRRRPGPTRGRAEPSHPTGDRRRARRASGEPPAAANGARHRSR